MDLTIPAPSDPPPLYLATADTERWRAVGGDPDGWAAFAAPEGARLLRAARRALPHLRSTTRGGRTPRRTVVPAAEAPLRAVPERGRVVGTTGQLVELVRRWRLRAATHLMVNVRSADPVGDLGRLAQG